jgi:hypothetical protein
MKGPEPSARNAKSPRLLAIFLGGSGILFVACGLWALHDLSFGGGASLLLFGLAEVGVTAELHRHNARGFLRVIAWLLAGFNALAIAYVLAIGWFIHALASSSGRWG